MARKSLIAEVSASVKTSKPAPDAEQVTRRQDGDVLEARSTSARIKTVDDLLAYIEADLSRYEVAASEATKWEVATAGEDGETTVTELHRVFVRLKPRGGPTTLEIVEAMIAGAKLPARKAKKPKQPKRDVLWQVLIVADAHFGGTPLHRRFPQASSPDHSLPGRRVSL